MVKAKIPAGGKQRHEPLVAQIKRAELGEGNLSAPGRRKSKGKRGHDPDGDGELDAKTSNKIMRLALEQENEMHDDMAVESLGVPDTEQLGGDETRDDEDLDSEVEQEEEEEYELDLDEEDAEAFQQFQSGRGVNLADMIMSKIDEHERGLDSKTTPARTRLDPQVVEVYSRVGQLLSRYKSGPLPKAFKILPSVAAWPTLLEATSPSTWTPHATMATTRVFSSGLDPKHCQRFYRDFLLPKVRDEIAENKKLSVHTYTALKRAIFKPAAFFKGIIFPLCSSGTCTLKEAAIIGSVLAKVSIPVLHSGAALLKLAEMPYTGSTSVFLRVLLDKKYALPFQVLDALVLHFLRFEKEVRTLPVLWHQSLLVFIQRYKQDLSPDQQSAIRHLVSVQHHHQISSEIVRELDSSSNQMID